VSAPASLPALVEDETSLLATLVPLAGARVLDLGCGTADFSRRLLTGGFVASVDALEVDAAQHAANRAAPPVPGLAFGTGAAEDIPFPEGCFDLVVMLKSLHHVPVARMDRALAEIARVLRPGGHFYASEPVFDGDFNEIVRLFHDEQAVRAAALAAIDRAAACGPLVPVARVPFLAPIAFRDFADFERRIMRVTHSTLHIPESTVAKVRERFERHLGPDGVRFDRPMRADLLRRRAP
jgi:SAM-dependent methyltransferase